MKWEGDVSGPLPPFLEYLEGVRAGDLPSLMLVCPPKSQTWNLRFLYVTVSTLNPMAGRESKLIVYVD